MTPTVLGDWEFAQPWFLAVVGLAPFLWNWTSRRGGMLTFSDVELFAEIPRTTRQRFIGLPSWSLALGCICLAIAMARPRTPDRPTRITEDGIAIMMIVDRSASMEARDLVPEDLSLDRLSVAKSVLRDFVLGKDGKRGRPQDVVGLIAFAGYADSLCPLTLDHDNLVAMVEMLEFANDDEAGTAIGDAIALAVSRLKLSDAKSKVAILLTDGVSNRGLIKPLQGAELAAESGVKVYCVGAGTNGYAPVPAIDEFGRRVLMRVRVEIDESTLRQVAEKTGGRYFRATDADALARIYDTIDQLERSKVESEQYLHYAEHYRPFLVTGSGLIALGILGTTLFLRIEP